MASVSRSSLLGRNWFPALKMRVTGIYHLDKIKTVQYVLVRKKVFDTKLRG